jgi:hypothetical protein
VKKFTEFLKTANYVGEIAHKFVAMIESYVKNQIKEQE